MCACGSCFTAVFQVTRAIVLSFGLAAVGVASFFFFFSSRRRHTISKRDWSSDVCSSDLETPISPIVTGPVLWTRDAYGSRFGIAAQVDRAGGPDRWYLWDINACGHDAFTVHSRYHASLAEALADWQVGVGTPAADGTVFAPVDDPGLLDDLLPREQGIMRPGGENVEQFAEYHRARRLAEAVIEAIEPAGPQRTSAPTDLAPKTAAALFTAWLREHRPDWSQPADFDELVAGLADA